MRIKRSVLVVVNDHQNRVDLRNFYEDLGHYVVSTATAADGLNLLQNISKPDVIIIGGDFPILSVSEFMNIVKADENLKSIPVALVKNKKGTLEGICMELDTRDRNSMAKLIDLCTETSH